ncbi:DNA repair protein XRCC3 [Tanacetum coccineum]|uniref:DNA repair protein XRCC3 n=1 Tax=Tanacetum coccineum TaxID=301880 RepID=A0ABQ5GJ25_9ASTR
MRPKLNLLKLLFTFTAPTNSLNGITAPVISLTPSSPSRIAVFSQLVKSFHSTHPILFESARDPTDHVFTREVHDAHQLFDILSHLSFCLENKETKLDVKMIVIDSIAALFRSEFENNARDLKKRCDLFFRISACLKGIAKRFGVAVVVTNQVVDLMDDGGTSGVRVGNIEWLWTSGRRVCPAFGVCRGRNCVNTRLFFVLV